MIFFLRRNTSLLVLEIVFSHASTTLAINHLTLELPMYSLKYLNRHGPQRMNPNDLGDLPDHSSSAIG